MGRLGAIQDQTRTAEIAPVDARIAIDHLRARLGDFPVSPRKAGSP